MNERNAKIVALAGKGGVGKTSLAASIVRVITEDRPGSRVLAIASLPLLASPSRARSTTYAVR